MALTARIRRGMKGGAKATTIPGSLTDSATTITAAASGLTTWSGATTNGPALAVINRGLSDEEVVSFTGISSNDLTTVGRGEAGTTAQAHAAGATLEHCSSKIDFDEANEIVAAMAKNSCRVYNDANISTPDSTLTALTFNQERYDTGALHSTSANTSRLTCVTAGKYAIFGCVEWVANTTGYRQLAIRLNGTTYIASRTQPAMTGVATQAVIATTYSLAAADYVELMVSQTSGGALNVAVQGNYSPEFGMSFVGF